MGWNFDVYLLKRATQRRTVQRKGRASSLGSGFNMKSNPIDGADLAARRARSSHLTICSRLTRSVSRAPAAMAVPKLICSTDVQHSGLVSLPLGRTGLGCPPSVMLPVLQTAIKSILHHRPQDGRQPGAAEGSE